jgi:hypothetical protein
LSNGNYHLNGWFGRLGEHRTIVLCALGALAILTYLPFLGLPPMQDDYLQIQLAERYGGPAGWAGLLQDPLYRCRATSILLTAATVHLFGWSMLVFNLSSMVLHALNVLLIAALGSCRWIGWPVSLVAAFVFAVRERHHEAVVWYASLHEPLVLLFSLLSALSLIKWLEGGSRGWVAASGFAWLAALGSKESGVVLAVVLPALAWLYPERRRAVFSLLAAGVAVTAAYFMLAFGHRAEHQHFNDGTFSFSTQIGRTLLNSAARGLWIWGGLSLATLAAYRAKVDLRLLAFSAAWFLAGLLPYSFLTYMPRIPSRHHYVASVGMSLIVSMAFWVFIQSRRRAPLIAAVLACVFVAHNWAYLWISKKPQFEWRAALIEDFVTFVAKEPGVPVVNGCHDLNSEEARNAIHYRLHLGPETLIPSATEAGVRVYHCIPPPGS